MSIYKLLSSEIKAATEELQKAGTLPSGLTLDKLDLTPPRDAGYGELASNAAMVIAAQTKGNPKQIAASLIERLANNPRIGQAEVAGPGFINLTLPAQQWQAALLDMLSQGPSYGDSEIGNKQRVCVEYVSANPTGPMHVGHARGAVYGDALASLLEKAGYEVTREYYVNDAGAQVDKLAESAYLRYREACGEKLEAIPEGLYPGDYLLPVGQELKKRFGESLMQAGRDEWLPPARKVALELMLELIKKDLAVLGIHHDLFVSELAITHAGKVEEAIAALDARGLIYQGIMEPPKGKAPDDWEPREQTLFKATDFGDDCDRPVRKSDGTWTYFAPDIAYHYDKYRRGFKMMINVFGADHGGYVKRLKAVVQALSGGEATLEIKLCQLVKFLRNGAPAKMSKRAGTFVTVREVADEVGKDAFRFIMLTRKNDVPLDFDFAKVMEQSKDNPVFYVQYAHARARSVLRRAAGEMPEALKVAEAADAGLAARLKHPQEIALIRLLAGWPRAVEAAAAALEPHRIAFWLHDVAAAFHGFWNLGNDELELRFLVKHDIELTAARIALARAVSLVLANGLCVLGVEPAEEMR